MAAFTESERDSSTVRPRPARPDGFDVENAEHIVANRYRLREQLGRGGMGVVWRAHDERLGRDVALKVLHPWVADDEELRARFEREAAALARAPAPERRPALRRRSRTRARRCSCSSSSRATALARRSSDGRTLDWNEARRLLAPVAAALAHAHARGVVHRDLTPSNVLVERGTGPRRRHRLRPRAPRARRDDRAGAPASSPARPSTGRPSRRPERETGPPRISTRSAASSSSSCRAACRSRARTGSRRVSGAPTRPRRRSGRSRRRRRTRPCSSSTALLARDPVARGTATDAALALGADAATLPDARPERRSLAIGRRLSRRRSSRGAARARHVVQRALREPVTIIREPATIVRQVRAHRVSASRPPRRRRARPGRGRGPCGRRLRHRGR